MDSTIKDTADNGGVLKVRYKRPRENTVKVLLLMDSGGSMDYYSQMCSALFQAVSKSGHFKDLKAYYFPVASPIVFLILLPHPLPEHFFYLFLRQAQQVEGG